MTVNLAPSPVFQGIGPSGPIPGGQLGTFVAGTSQPLATYVDATQTISNTNPVILNSSGQANVWLIAGQSYKFVMKDANGNPIWVVDNIPGGTSGQTSVNVMQFGATGDGSTNDAPAFQAALNSGAKSVYVPPPSNFYRLSSGIVVPVGVSLYGDAFQPTNAPTGTRLIFDLAVGICVTMGGPTANNGSCSVKAFSILRATGTPPAGSIGLLNQNTYATIIEDINSVSHQIPVKFMADGTVFGATCMVNRLFTGAAYDSHLVIDTMPEIRFNQCRFGMDGPGDQTCNSYVRIQGGSTTNAANGPGTIVWSSCQFNQGANTGTNVIAWQNRLSGSISDSTLFQIDNCYIEDQVVSLFSDATWTAINRVLITNTLFNVANASFNFLGLNAATQLSNCTISNCVINCGIAYAPTNQVNFLYVNNTLFLGLVSLSLPVNSVVDFNQCNYAGGLTLIGAHSACQYSGNITGGAFTKTGITSGRPLINLTPFNSVTPWTPNLQFGGANVGITYSVQQGSYQIIGDMVFCEFYINLTAAGSSTGTASISNIPVPDDPGLVGGAGGGAPTTGINMTGLTGAMFLQVGGGVANVVESSATGFGNVTNANFTSTTIFRGSFSYRRT